MTPRDGDAIEFWFDFSSGYAYFAAHTIDLVAERHGRSVAWRPYMLGVAFKRTGAQGLDLTSPAIVAKVAATVEIPPET